MTDNKDNILLSSKVYVVDIIGKTNAEMFCDVITGDTLEISVPIKRVGTGSSGASYSVYVTIRNLRTKQKTKKSFNQIERLLANFTLFEHSTVAQENTDDRAL